MTIVICSIPICRFVSSIHIQSHYVLWMMHLVLSHPRTWPMSSPPFSVNLLDGSVDHFRMPHLLPCMSSPPSCIAIQPMSFNQMVCHQWCLFVSITRGLDLVWPSMLVLALADWFLSHCPPQGPIDLVPVSSKCSTHHHHRQENVVTKFYLTHYIDNNFSMFILLLLHGQSSMQITFCLFINGTIVITAVLIATHMNLSNCSACYHHLFQLSLFDFENSLLKQIHSARCNLSPVCRQNPPSTSSALK